MYVAGATRMFFFPTAFEALKRNDNTSFKLSVLSISPPLGEKKKIVS